MQSLHNPDTLRAALFYIRYNLHVIALFTSCHLINIYVQNIFSNKISEIITVQFKILIFNVLDKSWIIMNF